ncbi:MAG: hypothetical protein VB021_06610 [Oscillospiraceae bacterium]|nr:hypothetical protein [Oscillospiraceae bacterium]
MKTSLRNYIAMCALLCAVLCGCSAAADDPGVARFVAPLENGGENIIPAEAPSVALGDKADVYGASASSSTVFTPDATWTIQENYFIHEEFYFIIPSAWLDHFKFETTTAEIKGYVNRQFNFDYTADGTDVKLMQIECVEQSLLDELEFYNSKQKIGASADGKYVYFVTYYDTTIPEDAPYTSNCINILGILMTDRGKITLTV